MNKLLILILTSIFLLSFINAEGLLISNNNYNFDKTYGENKTINILIQNTEDFTFYNIRSEDESKVYFTHFNLNGNTNKTFNATVIINEDFDGEIKIIGDYYTSIGSSNNTYHVDLDYNTGATPCNIEIIKGDSINWTNKDSSKNFKIKNYDTSEIIYELPASQTYKIQFNEPREINYIGEWLGMPFTQICNINILDDEGLVHSNSYDAKINLNINLIYHETTIEVTFLETNYEIKFNENKEDIFSIRNIGGAIAKNITLQGDWFTFTKNNFDLQPGSSTNVGYTIQPLLTLTNQTNITHQKEVRISGNFGNVTQTFNIFVPFASISTNFYNGSIDIEAMRSLFNAWCQMYPNECVRYTVVVGNGSNSNVTVSSETIKLMAEELGFTKQEIANMFNEIKEDNELNQLWKENITNKVLNLSQNIEQTNDQSERTIETSEVLVVSIMFIIIVIALFFIYTKFLKKKETENGLGFAKGEIL